MPRGTVNIKRLDTGESRDLLVDTSFPPLRREAFRRRSIQAMRDSLNIDNVAGGGTVATEGLWRREMVEFSGGAGQYSLDRKQDDDPTRFFSSKGVDVFTYPQRATLLPATQQLIANASADLLMSRCGDYIVVAAGGFVTAYNSSYETIGFFGAANTQYGGTQWTVVNSICSNDTYCFIATDTGLWFAQIGVDLNFSLYALPDSAPYGNYTMVRWANDQLIASAGPRLYAFQPRTVSTGTGTPFGSPPSVSNPGATPTAITSIFSNGANISTVVTSTPHGLVAGQRFSVNGTNNFAVVSTINLSGSTNTVTTLAPHGFAVGQQVRISLRFNGAPNGRIETVTVSSVPSNGTFTYTASKIHAAIVATGFTGGDVQGVNTTSGQGYCGDWIVLSIPTGLNPASLQITAAQTVYGQEALGGSIGNPSQNGTYAPDMLVTHENPNWTWSDAAGGQTQVYFGGYVKGATANHSGSIVRSDLLGSSTSSTTGVQTISATSVAQPWMLDTPVECLPLAPDEYPTCVQAYLNYIFVGTNRGIRMCQTLSIYDPTATSTGDLKSGPLIPNILQPVTLPVTAIVGDGRFVWFAWNNYDDASTGLGKLNLQQFIAQDPLAPVYASDLMVEGNGIINSLDWDPINNVPIMAVQGLGIYGPFATNEGGNLVASQFVAQGTLVSSYFDFGIAEPKIPVFFDYGAYINYNDGNESQGAIGGLVVMDPLRQYPVPTVITLDGYDANTQPNEEAIYQTGGENDRGTQFQVTLYLDTQDTSSAPTLYRWTLKAWPTVVQGTEVMIVAEVFAQTEVDGAITSNNVEEVYNWLEGLRWDQTLCVYTDGESSALGIIELIDDVADKPGGEEPLEGFEGDFVITFKTLAAWVYTAAVTA